MLVTVLAHDVSYFVHLGRLRPGDRVVYRTACRSTTFTVLGHQVVAEGTPIPTRSSPALVLDACYPPNALFFTTQRLLVWVTESAPSPGGTAVTGGRGRWARPSGVTRTVPPADRVAYSAPAPLALVSQGLTLQQNEAPMGAMALTGDPAPGWVQSPGPLALEGAALEAYFGGLRSAQQEQTGWWAAIATPGLAMPPVLVGATPATTHHWTCRSTPPAGCRSGWCCRPP